MNQQSQETYSISQVSEKTGVTETRIRDWHEKGYLPEVQSISVGSRFHRRFTDKDIETIQRITRYQGQGYTLKAAAERSGEEKKRRKEGNEDDIRMS